MEMFNTLAGLISPEITTTIVIKKTANGKMTVITNFTTEKGGVCDALAPFTLKGTPQEMDEGFLDAIKAPVETVTGLVSNMEAFQKAAQQAEKNAKSASTAKPAATRTPNQFEIQRKKLEAEAAARRKNHEAAMKQADEANASGNYYTSEAFLELAATLTDNTKTKAEIAKRIKAQASGKDGFLCNDDPETAKAAIEAFNATLVKPEAAPVQKTPAAEAADNNPDTTAETAEEAEEQQDDLQESDSDEQDNIEDSSIDVDEINEAA